MTRLLTELGLALVYALMALMIVAGLAGLLIVAGSAGSVWPDVRLGV